MPANNLQKARLNPFPLIYIIRNDFLGHTVQLLLWTQIKVKPIVLSFVCVIYCDQLWPHIPLSFMCFSGDIVYTWETANIKPLIKSWSQETHTTQHFLPAINTPPAPTEHNLIKNRMKVQNSVIMVYKLNWNMLLWQ